VGFGGVLGNGQGWLGAMAVRDGCGPAVRHFLFFARF